MSTCLDDPNALTMDELDRLYRRVVYNIRGSFPELIAGTFDVSQLYQQIVPYPPTGASWRSTPTKRMNSP